MSTVPDGLPSLAYGGHVAGQGKACIMEYISVMKGEQFSDRPSCTHPAIAQVARSTNDRFTDDTRHELLQFFDRLASAGEQSERVTYALQATIRSDRAQEVLRQESINEGIHHMERDWGLICGVMEEAYQRGMTAVQQVVDVSERGYRFNPDVLQSIAETARIHREKMLANARALMAYLDELLTAYEQATATTPKVIPAEALSKAKELVSSGNYVPGLALV